MADTQSVGERLTFDEFTNLPRATAGHYELHDRRLVTVLPRHSSRAKIQQNVLELLLPITSGKGFLTIEFPFHAPGDEVWQADIGFVRQERQISDPYLRGVPDLVIEVQSLIITAYELHDKMDVCMTNGCSAFWVIDPKRQTVSVSSFDRSSGRSMLITQIYRVGTSVTLPVPLEGEIPVASIFNTLMQASR